MLDNGVLRHYFNNFSWLGFVVTYNIEAQWVTIQFDHICVEHLACCNWL